MVRRTIQPGLVHVWEVSLSRPVEADVHWAHLSVAERARAQRFHFSRDRDRFVRAHSALRQILSEYLNARPDQLEFITGHAGKPALVAEAGEPVIEFNLSHSGDYALVAVSGQRAVGVDIEKWDSRVEFLELADHYFSPHERIALRGLPSELVVQGFFQAWSRKEAYLKATGNGITAGLHHFDVTLAPGELAMLLADRHDHSACDRWAMTDLPVAEGYSAAVVLEAPLLQVTYMTYNS